MKEQDEATPASERKDSARVRKAKWLGARVAMMEKEVKNRSDICEGHLAEIDLYKKVIEREIRTDAIINQHCNAMTSIRDLMLIAGGHKFDGRRFSWSWVKMGLFFDEDEDSVVLGDQTGEIDDIMSEAAHLEMGETKDELENQAAQALALMARSDDATATIVDLMKESMPTALYALTIGLFKAGRKYQRQVEIEGKIGEARKKLEKERSSS